MLKKKPLPRQWGALPIHCISISLNISNDGEHSPSMMFPSLPSIYNDGKHFPSFISSSPKASLMMNGTPYLKILHFPLPTALKIRRIATPWFKTS
jgi:hypothetical protein